MKKILPWIATALVAIVVVVVISAWLLVRGSLPVLDGEYAV